MPRINHEVCGLTIFHNLVTTTARLRQNCVPGNQLTVSFLKVQTINE